MVFDGLEKSWVEYAIEDKLKEIKFWEEELKALGEDTKDVAKVIKALESALNKVRENK